MWYLGHCRSTKAGCVMKRRRPLAAIHISPSLTKVLHLQNQGSHTVWTLSWAAESQHTAPQLLWQDQHLECISTLTVAALGCLLLYIHTVNNHHDCTAQGSWDCTTNASFLILAAWWRWICHDLFHSKGAFFILDNYTSFMRHLAWYTTRQIAPFEFLTWGLECRT